MYLLVPVVYRLHTMPERCKYYAQMCIKSEYSLAVDAELMQMNALILVDTRSMWNNVINVYNNILYIKILQRLNANKPISRQSINLYLTCHLRTFILCDVKYFLLSSPHPRSSSLSFLLHIQEYESRSSFNRFNLHPNYLILITRVTRIFNSSTFLLDQKKLKSSLLSPS